MMVFKFVTLLLCWIVVGVVSAPLRISPPERVDWYMDEPAQLEFEVLKPITGGVLGAFPAILGGRVDIEIPQSPFWDLTRFINRANKGGCYIVPTVRHQLPHTIC